MGIAKSGETSSVAALRGLDNRGVIVNHGLTPMATAVPFAAANLKVAAVSAA
jgi:hypothetical protein